MVKFLKKNYVQLIIIIFIITIILNIVIGAIYIPETISKNEMLDSTTITVSSKLIDLGRIKLNNPANAIFKLINNGNIPLIISKVDVSCHCTVVNWKSNPIPPHDSTFIKASYDSSIPGYFLKKITVFSNAKNDPMLFLVMRGRIIMSTVEPSTK